jgi:uncharacterized damage-inducible protein DinB
MKYRVELFNMNNPAEHRLVEVCAESQDEAEDIAVSSGLMSLQSGWGVFDSEEI